MAEREKMLQAGIERWLRESKLVPCCQKCLVWEMEVASATSQHIFMFEAQGVADASQISQYFN